MYEATRIPKSAMTKSPEELRLKAGESVLDAVGRTPLIRMVRLTRHLGPGVAVYAKLERGNPGGSVKDRAACRMIADAEASGLLTSGKIILDSTSGNTGISYAMIGAVKGYRVRIVIPENASPERKKIMTGFGADLIYSSPFEGADGAIRMAKEIIQSHPGKYYQPDQYNNPSNVMAHSTTTGPELMEQTSGRITHFVACVGTGGTIMGTGQALKGFNPDVKIISVHPDDAFHGIEGLKYLGDGSIVPGIFNISFPDGRQFVSTEAAYAMTKRIIREEGIFAGHSSGAAMVAALRTAETISEGTIVVMFPDGGDRYLSRDI